MKRVLVTGGYNIGSAGVATIVYNWGQNFDSSKIVYDYLMQRGLPQKHYLEKIQEKGGKIHTLSKRNKNAIGIIKWITQIVKDNNYDILHINTDTAYIAAAYIYAAKKGGVKKIFVHSHSTQIDETDIWKRMIKNLLHRLCRAYVKSNSLLYLACSEPAGEWMFGKKGVCTSKYRFIYNGVRLEDYSFKSEVRVIMRKELGIGDELVLGNVGRLAYQKNHMFLLEIFEGIYRMHKNCKLILVGSGPLENELKEKAKRMGIEKNIMFLGIRNDIAQILQAMDVFVMPSKFEGLPVTLVEAQASSLPCVISNVITQEVKFTDYVKSVDLTEPVEVWCKVIEDACKMKRNANVNQLEISPFNIKNASLELQKVFLQE